MDYSSQGRAVTSNDFKTIIPTLFANTQSVQVWGGEDNDPAVYGKVFASVKTTTGSNLTSTQKTSLETALKAFTVGSIRTEIVDPETIKLRLTVTYKYNSTATTKTLSDISSLVTTTLTNYNTNNLQVFNQPFRFSEIVGQIDDTDSSIVSNITTVQMAKEFTPTLNTATAYTIDFKNAFYNPHSGHNSSDGGVISSTGFILSDDTNEQFLGDDGAGNLITYYISGT